jgi:hypothetical protein
MKLRVYHAKLMNGDDILGYYDGQLEQGCHRFYDPMLVEERLNPNTGNAVMVLNQFSPFGIREEILLPTSHVLFVTPVSDEYENYYKISKTYNKKYIYPAQMKELTKVTEAMEDVLFNKEAKTSKLVKLKTSKGSNTSFH